jgi:DNA-binding GntR family transcriptional regulator
VPAVSPAPQPPIVRRFAASPASLPKHLRLHQAVVGAVEAGELACGSKLAGERELSVALGLSLGTTQKALGRLTEEGFLVRKHGHGTFVGSPRKPIGGAWHFRFVDPGTGHEESVFATVAERSLITRTGPWSDVLGPDEKGYVLLRRQVDVGGKFLCASRMYLPASRFGRLLRIGIKRLDNTNLKTILAEEFAAATLSSDGLAFVREIESQDARLMGLKPGFTGMQLHITARGIGRVPISFQVVSIPPTADGLRVEFHPPDRG